jgi:three-Cys-motif partner protein
VQPESGTLWEADPHTLAKHAILKGYLEAWMAILSHESSRRRGVERVLYLDGFAGPGEYVKGEPGSPIVAAEVALKHSHPFPTRVRLVFIEADPDRHRHLAGLVEQMAPRLAVRTDVEVLAPILGDCATELNKTLDAYDQHGKRFGPALVFLDQNGYSLAPMSLTKRLMQHPMCEVFAFLNCRDLHRFLEDPTKAAGITAAYGSDKWRAAMALSGRDREQLLLDEYRRSLREAHLRQWKTEEPLWRPQNRVFDRDSPKSVVVPVDAVCA